MVVMLVTVPLYLKVLGDVRYGVLALVWLVLGYFSFLEMGLGKSTANHIARLHDAPDKERGTLFWTALLVNAAFGLVAAFILWGIGTYLLSSVLKIPAEFQSEALGALPWMITTLPLALVSSVLNGALEGRNRFFAVNVLQVASAIVFQVVPLVAAYLYGPSLSFVIPAAVLSRALMNIPFLMACYTYVPLTSYPSFSKEPAKSLLSYGGWVALTGIISPLLATIDRFLIGIVLGAQSVTYYVLPSQLVYRATVIPGSLSRVLFPQFSTKNSIDNDSLARSALSTLTVVMTPITIGGIVLLKPFMQLWVGDEIAAIAAPLGEILFLGVWANSLAYIPYSFLQGKGRPDLVAKLHVVEIGPFLFMLWSVIHYWGIYGAAWVWTFRAIIDAMFLFFLSGIEKNYAKVVIIPLLMIFCSMIVSHYLIEEAWIARIILIGLMLFLMILWIIFKRLKYKLFTADGNFLVHRSKL